MLSLPGCGALSPVVDDWCVMILPDGDFNPHGSLETFNGGNVELYHHTYAHA